MDDDVKKVQIKETYTLRHKPKDGSKFMSIEPNKINLDIDFEIKYSNELIGNQRNVVKVYENDLSEI